MRTRLITRSAAYITHLTIGEVEDALRNSDLIRVEGDNMAEKVYLNPMAVETVREDTA